MRSVVMVSKLELKSEMTTTLMIRMGEVQPELLKLDMNVLEEVRNQKTHVPQYVEMD